jgi:alkylated DNA repair dioxygenase AlkB
MSKRGALDTFFKPTAPKKPKYEASTEKTSHASYPFAVPCLPSSFIEQLATCPTVADGTSIDNDPKYPDLDLVIHRPYIPSSISGGMFEFLRQELFFYRVVYQITRGGINATVNTPRYTTVFGVDETSRFSAGNLVDSKSSRPIEARRYKCDPRPLPACLESLKQIVEATTGETFNFCLVNYYADGKDSISYHSDDERFLGDDPAIASLSLGAKRDFYMKHKPVAPSIGTPAQPEPKVLQLSLGPGDMMLMRGTTQKNWLHSIPKRAGAANAVGVGRINITFRKALVKAGTENYYQYNVGKGQVFKWGAKEGKMIPWTEGVGAGFAVVGPSGAT